MDFCINDTEVLLFGSCLCVPNVDDIRKQLMLEVHATPYIMHPGSTKMYQDLKKSFRWHGMKQDVAVYVQTCLTCQ